MHGYGATGPVSGASMKGRPLRGGDWVPVDTRSDACDASMKGRPLRGGDGREPQERQAERFHASMKGRPLRGGDVIDARPYGGQCEQPR